MTTYKWILLSGALFAFTGVAAGAFGAHALKQRLSFEDLSIFEVGVRYQMYHALALIALAPLLQSLDLSDLSKAAILFISGTLIFSGSLYVLVLSGMRWMGAITPIGGVLLLLGWLFVIKAALRSQ